MLISPKNDQQDAYKVHIFGNQCFSIFTACCYTKLPNNKKVRNDNFIVVTKNSDHDTVAFMSSLQKVVLKIEHMHEKTYENVYVRNDGMRSQFRYRNVFKLLASTALPGKTLSWHYNERHHAKGPIDKLIKGNGEECYF